MPLVGCWHRKHWIYVPLWSILVWLLLELWMSLGDRNWSPLGALGPSCGWYKVIAVFWDSISFLTEQKGPSRSRETADQDLILFSPFSLCPLLVYFWNKLPASWYPERLVPYKVFSALIPVVGKPYRNSTFIFTACLWGGRFLESKMEAKGHVHGYFLFLALFSLSRGSVPSLFLKYMILLYLR